MRVEVGFPGCEKAIKAGGEALWMWLAMKTYCKVNETDGLVPACMIGRLQGPEPTRQKRLVARLVTAGLVDVAGPDFMLHDYLDWEESSTDAAKRRAAARKRKADWEQRHGMREERNGNTVPNTVPDDEGNAVPNAGVTVGGTDHREGEGREGKGKEDPPIAPQGGPTRGGDPWGLTPAAEPAHERKTSRGPSRRTVMPDGWSPSDAHRAMAAELGVSVDAERAAFTDHHLAKRSTFADWDAAFRTWLRNAQKFATRNGGGGVVSTATARAEHRRRILDSIVVED